MKVSNDPKTTKAPMRPWKVIVLDILLTCLILAVFGFFHFVLPAALAARQAREEAAARTPSPSPTAAPTPGPTDGPTPEPTEDPRTPWQIRFADHFSDHVIQTENSYRSPNVSIQVETFVTSDERDDSQIVYHVADIYVASPENFRTCTANDELKYYSIQDPIEMDAASGALLSISGDFYACQRYGFLVRNGQVYRQDHAYCDICVLFEDGSIGIYPPDGYDIDELMEKGVAQVWNFGPSLLDAEGHAMERYQANPPVSYQNPRSALGYYEPGHYCFVVVDGRQANYSRGMTLPQLARVFEDLGCTSAYNLDGGGSAVMFFDHRKYNRQSNGGDRQLSDLLIIVESEGTE